MTQTAECIIRTARSGEATEVLLPSQRLLVAEVDGRVVGYLHGLTHLAFHAGGSVGWIEELMVAESSRGRGVGRTLMAAFEGWAVESADVRYVAVATRRAEGLYLALGYERSATYLKKPLTR